MCLKEFTHNFGLDWAFYECNVLTSVTIPDSVESIGEATFAYCSALEDITIGKGLKAIGNNAFYECTGLPSVNIPDNVETIGESAFYNCTSLASVTMGSGVKTISRYAFSGCTALTKVYYHGTAAEWNAISFSIYNDKLTSATICYTMHTGYCGGDTTAEQDTASGAYKNLSWQFDEVTGELSISGSGAMVDRTDEVAASWSSYKDKITSITIGDAVTSIGNFAFYNCSAFTSIDIPDSVKSIGDYAFYACTALTSVAISDNMESIKKRLSMNVFLCRRSA